MERFHLSSAPRHASLHLSDVLAPERVCILESTDKAGVLEELAARLAAAPEVSDAPALGAAILAREGLMSTGIGLGIGVPHVRIESVRDIVMAAGLSRTGIKGYDSLDNAPVRLVFMIAAAPSQHAEYIRLLALVSRLVKEQSVREALLSAADASLLYRMLIGGGAPSPASPAA